MNDDSIAIIGASCRFPGAPNLDAFWELLTSGTDAIAEVDERRWATRFYYHPRQGEPGKSYTWSAGLIGDVEGFDPAFFGISPREAAQMDPQQRILLELAWHAAEDAGIPPSRLAGSTTGVYIGASSTDYRDMRFGDPANGDANSMTGSTLSIVANRLSYIFDLRGPSLTIDTACSSSLVALHHACDAIRGERIATAIVGGINLLLAPYPFLGFCRAGMLSRRGRCFAFDERADGYVRGEGGGVVILKPLSQALADGDRVRAVILGTGVNSDGRTIGLSLPSEAAQSALIRAVCARSGITPDDLAFFEMHGTGTPAGDPIEAAAVGRALGQARRDPLPIGSVKTNIGHLEPASGMAGLIKAALALEKGVVPPTLNCDTPNPKIAFDALNLRLVSAAEPIAGGECAGVNSFGFGGTNGHVVLRAAPAAADTAAPRNEKLPPLLISARSAASLRQLAERWRQTLADAPAERVPALLRGAARYREQHSERLVAFGDDLQETVAALSDFAAGAENPGAVTGSAVRAGKLAFVFAGNGAQWPGMGRNAYAASPAFRAAVAEADAVLRPALGWSVAAAIETRVEADRLARADVAQPLLFATQVGIVAVLRGLGIEAAGHIGHSVGEIAAAWAAGALSLDEAARVVVARSRHQERTRGQGRMAALALGEEAAADLIAETGIPLEIGAINASQSVTLSGPGEAIDRIGAEAQRRGIAFRALDLDFAFHSAAMDPIEQGLLGDLGGLTSHPPQSLLLSTVTGEPVEAGALDADYWWRNIRSPVRFTDGIKALVEDGCRIFVEIGPNPVLQSYLHDALRGVDGQGRVLASLSRKQGEEDPFPAIAARCHVAGYDLGRTARFDGAAELDGLPLYPWGREAFWFEDTVEASRPADPPYEHPLLGFRQVAPVPFWLNYLDPELLPWLADHAVEGVPILPAAAVVEMALAVARLRRPEARSLEIADVELRRPLAFEKGHSREVRTVLLGEDGDFELSSRLRLADEPLTVHAVGRLLTGTEQASAAQLEPADAAQGRVDRDSLYRLATQLGLDYGPSFQVVRHIDLLGEGEALAELDPAVLADGSAGYVLHPALLDGALQALLALIVERQGESQGATFLPWRFGRVRVIAPFGRDIRRVRLRVTRVGSRSISADLALFDEIGTAIAELSDCWFRRVELSRRGSLEDRVLRIEQVPAPLAEAGAPPALDRFAEFVDSHAAARKDCAVADESALLLDGLLAAVAAKAVSVIVDPAIPFTIEELQESGAVAADAGGLFHSLLCLLERFGAASASGRVWQIADENSLPDIDEVWRLLLAETPELVAELALVAAAADELPRLLPAGLREADAAPWPMVEHLLHGSPAGATAIAFACDVLGGIAVDWPAGRPLRVLEIGADGGVTRRLIDRLSRSGTAFRYRATSPDPEQATRLGSLLAGVAGAAAGCWPPSETADELDGERFDVVVAVHAAGRLPLEPAILARVREFLAPEGVFLAVEPEPNPLWDIVFGRYAGWWRGGAVSPLKAKEDWRSALAIAGFAETGMAAVATAPWPISAVWGRTEAIAAPTGQELPTPQAITVIGAGPGAAAFCDALALAGHRVSEAEPAAFAAAEFEPVEGDDRLALFVLDEADDEGDRTVERTAQLIALFARIATVAARQQLPLWLITAGVQQPAESGDAAVIGAALWGFGRVLVNEMPRLSLRLVDIAASKDWAERGRCIAAELQADSPETEVVWTATGRHVLRLRRGLPPVWAAEGDSVRLSSEATGGLDALGWQLTQPRPPGPGEVVVDVHAAGLNFRDIMWAMGLVPEEALIDGFTGPSFGLECAGVVAAIGPGVDTLAVGDRVAGFAPAALGSRVTTAARALTRIGPDTSFAAAATIPVTFVTAIYALGTLARLAPGELVLIHAAAGGVGLAAIQYAKHRGAVVIATAGSEVKRAFLRLAGADHVLDSRDLGFADAVRAISGGAGVDVVLNSLSGEAMEQSLAVLKPFGRFLELGKRDFYLNRRIHLRPLRQNISYFAIDVDQLPVQRPDLAQALLSEIAAALDDGAIRPLAHRTFPFAAAGDAFRLMQASGHIGKIVLTPDGNNGVRLRRRPEIGLRGDGTYLVTGGITGFGFAAARWLAQHGAGSIALLGRRGMGTPGAAERIAELAELGVEARIYAGDVADPISLGTALAEIRAGGKPLRGVVHAAAAIADGLAADLDGTGIADILRAKLGGALALDRLTRDDPIELFVLFSSATTLLGAPGQGIYVAGNHAIETLARRRRAEGRPAVAVAWGPIEDTGYLAERPETRDALARRLGAKPMPAGQALAGLSAVAGSGLPVAAIAETSWNEARRFLPILAAPLFADLRGDAGASVGDDSLIERLVGLDVEEAAGVLRGAVAEEAAHILRLPVGSIDPMRPLSELGMDSLMAVELRLGLESRLRVELPLMSLAEGTSVASIATRLAGALTARSQASQLVTMAERYELADDERLAAVANAASRFEVDSAAAE